MNSKKPPLILSFFVIISLLLSGCNGKLPGGDARKNSSDPKERVALINRDDTELLRKIDDRRATGSR